MWSSAVLVALATLITMSSEFLFDDQCNGPVQCSCALPIVDCSDRQLPRIPEFNLTNHQNMLYLYLQKNRIIVVPQDSFGGMNSDKLYLDLSSNNMRDIHPMAFDGVQDNVTILKLEHNLLSALPAALANLTKLTYLDVHDNPIATFDSSVMEPLGSHLGALYVGSSAIKSWPAEFQFLKHLNSLHLLGAVFNDIPQHAFQTFANSLVSLEISGCNLTRVPEALCDLKRWKKFYFTDNLNLDNDDILPHCNLPATSVTTISLDNNQLSNVPIRIFDLFPNLASLSISSNQHLDTMAGVSVPKGTVLTSLTMVENNFTHVPFEIGELTSLRVLDFHSNNLAEILDRDLDHLTHLTRLILSDNPLKRIENNSFTNESSLFHLSLDNTELPSIPYALLDLSNLHTLDFKGNSLECACSDLSWLSSSNHTSDLRVTGYCGNTNGHFNEPIQTFIDLELQRCP